MTIREHLEAIVDLGCEWPDMVAGDIHEHAKAALELLKQARRITVYDQGTGSEKGIFLPDPARDADA